MIYVFLADGFEEIEALAVVDILRRADIETVTVGVTGQTVTGSHKITVVADITVDETKIRDLEGVVLPGGIPGTPNLKRNNRVMEILDYCNENNLLVSAICAAPSILGQKGILNGKNAICYPGFEEELLGAEIASCSVAVDGNIITGKGAGVAVDFALEIVKYLKNEETSNTIKKSMCCR